MAVAIDIVVVVVVVVVDAAVVARCGGSLQLSQRQPQRKSALSLKRLSQIAVGKDDSVVDSVHAAGAFVVVQFGHHLHKPGFYYSFCSWVLQIGRRPALSWQQPAAG